MRAIHTLSTVGKLLSLCIGLVRKSEFGFELEKIYIERKKLFHQNRGEEESLPTERGVNYTGAIFVII